MALKVREAFDSVQANVRTFEPVVLRQRSPGDGRRAQRQDRRRGHYSAAVLAPRLPAGAPAAGTRGRQQRQLHELVARTEDGRAHRRAERSRGRTAHPAEHRARNGRALSLHRVHEVPAARLDHSGDVRLGDDRRRHALHRRQGARHSRRLPGHADHAHRTGLRAQPRGRYQGRCFRRRDHHHRIAALRCGQHLPSATCSSA